MRFLAVYYHQSYSKNRGLSNFGDDINPYLLGELFHHSIIDSDEICLIGIGTILNDRELSRVDHYKNKIVFSSGVGYGCLDLSRFDSSWDFACVRGPKSAKSLHLGAEKAVADGAILLPAVLNNTISGTEKRYAATLIPHVESHITSGVGLKKLCGELGVHYLSPSADSSAFMLDVARSDRVLTEAMHGAILADSLRVPWVPIKFHLHESFKWEDWCQSMTLPYSFTELGPEFWDKKQGSFSRIKHGWQHLKQKKCKQKLMHILSSCEPLLSESAVFESRVDTLLSCVKVINDRYAC